MSAAPKYDDPLAYAYLDERDARGRPLYYGHQRIEPLRERDCGALELWRRRIRVAYARGDRAAYLRLSLLLSTAMAGMQIAAQKEAPFKEAA